MANSKSALRRVVMESTIPVEARAEIARLLETYERLLPAYAHLAVTWDGTRAVPETGWFGFFPIDDAEGGIVLRIDANKWHILDGQREQAFVEALVESALDRCGTRGDIILGQTALERYLRDSAVEAIDVVWLAEECVADPAFRSSLIERWGR